MGWSTCFIWVSSYGETLQYRLELEVSKCTKYDKSWDRVKVINLVGEHISKNIMAIEVLDQNLMACLDEGGKEGE